MDVVVITGAIKRAKLQPICHQQQTNTQLFTGQWPFLLPDQQCQNTDVYKIINFSFMVNLFSDSNFTLPHVKNSVIAKLSICVCLPLKSLQSCGQGIPHKMHNESYQ